jgi:hypothetical protein
LIFDEGRHEEEGLSTFEEGRVYFRIIEIEPDDITRAGKNVGDRTRCARTDPNVRATRKQGATNLSTHGAARTD